MFPAISCPASTNSISANMGCVGGGPNSFTGDGFSNKLWDGWQLKDFKCCELDIFLWLG